MLQINIALSQESWDEEKEEFILPEYKTIRLEHSLVSLSKWESRWGKPFLKSLEKSLTLEETIDYIKCMTITQNVDSDVYNHISNGNIKEIIAYIEAPMTATTFSNTEKNRINGEIITAELIYYWMISLGIPFECQKWHLNRLITLIRVCSIKNSPGKKMAKMDIAARNKALNEARRKKYNTKG